MHQQEGPVEVLDAGGTVLLLLHHASPDTVQAPLLKSAVTFHVLE
jgi:hypothetical protein